MPPFKYLAYLYVGTSDFQADCDYYVNVLNARCVWAFENFGAKVAAFQLTDSKPFVLLADHMPAPSVQPIYAVDDLAATMKELESRGWQKFEGPMGTPNGMACVFKDPSGNSFAILQDDNPTSMEDAYANANHSTALRNIGKPKS